MEIDFILPQVKNIGSRISKAVPDGIPNVILRNPFHLPQAFMITR